MKYRICCPYCTQEAKLVKGSKVYPMRFDLADKYFFMCEPCEAWVGCHPTSKVPLGRLADANLRRAKSAVHVAFDPIWESRVKTRAAAYRWLAEELGIPFVDCHIGMFDLKTCEQAIAICTKYLTENS